MQNSIFTELLTFVKTTADADQLESQIERLLTRIFQINKQSFEKELEANLNLNLAGAIKRIFTTQNLSYSKPEEMKAFLEQMRKELTACKVLTLTISFEPSHETIDLFFDWVRRELGPGIILELNADKTIVGGAIIVYQGKFMDMSIRKKLDDLFILKKEELAKIIG